MRPLLNLVRQYRQELEAKATAGEDTEAEELEASLIDFFEAAWPEVDPAPLQVNWHHRAIAEHLEAVAKGQIRKLLINVPPRHTKTILTSVVFPAWVWARQPNPEYPLTGPQAKFLCLSYSDQLVMDNATLARRLINSEWYQAHWGNRVIIASDQDAKNKFDTTAGGTRISASFGGTILGRGGDYKIIDDPHKVDEAEFEVVRESVIRNYDGTLKSRITDPRTSAEIIIMQRLHENDLAGHVLDTDPDFVHLNLPAEYDSGRHCTTSIGWEDPRQEDGELLWRDRFGERELEPYKRKPYEWSGQWQQAPAPRGGGIIKREWWQLWEAPDNKFPEFEYIIASLDGAFTEKEENDPSALTVWGVWSKSAMTTVDDKTGHIWLGEGPRERRLMLIHAWRKRLQFSGPRIERKPNESAAMYRQRTMKDWGLIEWIEYTCTRYKVDKLLIEAKASGISAGQELRNRFPNLSFGI